MHGVTAPKQRANDGTPLWNAQLGYGIGSHGSGVSASADTTIIPGVMFRARYQGASVTTGESTFGIELVAGLNFQGGITPGDRHADDLRLSPCPSSLRVPSLALSPMRKATH